MSKKFLSPMHRAMRQIGIHLEEACRPLGVTTTEGHVLSFLRSYAPCAVGELHRVFGLKRSTLTSVLDRLERRSLVRRTTDPEDRRSVQVAITARGRRVGDEIQGSLDALERAIESHVRTRDVAAFHRVLDAIAEATGVEVRRAGVTRSNERK